MTASLPPELSSELAEAGSEAEAEDSGELPEELLVPPPLLQETRLPADMAAASAIAHSFLSLRLLFTIDPLLMSGAPLLNRGTGLSMMHRLYGQGCFLLSNICLHSGYMPLLYQKESCLSSTFISDF